MICQHLNTIGSISQTGEDAPLLTYSQIPRNNIISSKHLLIDVLLLVDIYCFIKMELVKEATSLA